MFGKVYTLMIALKIMLLCLTTNFWNYGSQHKKCEDGTTGVPYKRKKWPNSWQEAEGNILPLYGVCETRKFDTAHKFQINRF